MPVFQRGKMQIEFKEGLSRGLIAYDRLASLQKRIVDSNDEDIEIYMQKDGRLGRTFTFLLGCLPLLGEQYGKSVKLYLPPHAMKNVKDMDIYDYFGDTSTKCQRFRKIESEEDVIDLSLEIINDFPLNMNELLQERLISRVGEMYNNAFEHSEAKNIMGGKHFKPVNGQKYYCFSCYDTGIGITNKVKKFLKKADLSDEDSLKWALKVGNTTSIGLSRGLGLSWLLKFAEANNGKIRICTGNLLYTYSNNTGEKFEKLKNQFYGTLFEMDVLQDQRNMYILEGNKNGRD